MFLHILHASGKVLEARLVGNGVWLREGAEEWELTFATQGPAAGHTKLTRRGKVAIDRDLTNNVTPQTGLYGN